MESILHMPVELSESILDHLDQPSLQAFSLVTHKYTFSAQRRLFRKLRKELRPRGRPEMLAQLTAFLFETTRIASNVREVHLYCQYRYPYCDKKLFMEELSSLIYRLPKLETVNLSNLIFMLSTNSPRILPPVSFLTPILNLTLDGVDLDRNALAVLLRNLSFTHTLEFCRLRVSNEGLVARLAPSPASLYILGGKGYDYLSDFQDTSTLTTFTVDFIGCVKTTRLNHVTSFISNHGAAIQILSLNLCGLSLIAQDFRSTIHLPNLATACPKLKHLHVDLLTGIGFRPDEEDSVLHQLHLATVLLQSASVSRLTEVVLALLIASEDDSWLSSPEAFSLPGDWSKIAHALGNLQTLVSVRILQRHHTDADVRKDGQPLPPHWQEWFSKVFTSFKGRHVVQFV